MIILAYTAPLLQVDPKTLGVNLWLIIAGIILLTGVGVLAIALWTAIKSWIAIAGQRQSREDYAKRFHRAD